MLGIERRPTAHRSAYLEKPLDQQDLQPVPSRKGKEVDKTERLLDTEANKWNTMPTQKLSKKQRQAVRYPVPHEGDSLSLSHRPNRIPLALNGSTCPRPKSRRPSSERSRRCVSPAHSTPSTFNEAKRNEIAARCQSSFRSVLSYTWCLGLTQCTDRTCHRQPTSRFDQRFCACCEEALLCGNAGRRYGGSGIRKEEVQRGATTWCRGRQGILSSEDGRAKGSEVMRALHCTSTCIFVY